MATRRARGDESRAEQSRKADARPAMRSRFAGNLSLPESVLKDAKARKVRLHWMATSIVGDQGLASTQLGNRMMRAWTPVPATQYPELTTVILPGRQASEIIERGGMVLMEKPLHLWQADREELRRENLKEMQTIKWADQPSTGGDLPMPRFDAVNQTSHRHVVESGGGNNAGAQFQGDDE
jgi:hypothetical protein